MAATVCLGSPRSEEHTSELQSLRHLVCRLLLEKKNVIPQHALRGRRVRDGSTVVRARRGDGVPLHALRGRRVRDGRTVVRARRGYFFFNDTAPTDIYTLSLHDALPISKRSNELYRRNLEKGQTGLSVAFDLPTQTGYDPDHELARGEVGKVGVSIAHERDMQTLLEGIPLGETT